MEGYLCIVKKKWILRENKIKITVISNSQNFKTSQTLLTFTLLGFFFLFTRVHSTWASGQPRLRLRLVAVHSKFPSLSFVWFSRKKLKSIIDSQEKAEKLPKMERARASGYFCRKTWTGIDVLCKRELRASPVMYSANHPWQFLLPASLILGDHFKRLQILL